MKTNNRFKKIKITFTAVGFMIAVVLASVASARAETWTQKADMPTPRWSHSAAVVNGKIYVIGGLTSETAFLNGQPISAVEEYDPTTDTWARKADMPEPRAGSEGSHPVVDGKIYVIGGGGRTSVARVDVYDPATDTWSRAADMPTAKMLLPSVAWGGKIYTFGGLTGTLHSSTGTTTLRVTEVFDPKTDTWAQATSMPYAVWGHSAVEVSDKIYVIGGASGRNAIRLLQVYDPQTDTWTEATPMPLRTRDFGATAVCSEIYEFGGWYNSGLRPYAYAWVYEPSTDTWTEGVRLPDFRAAFSISAVNGKIYAIGGTPRQHNCQATSTVYELDLELGVPQPDFNGDGIIDSMDIIMMVDYWGTDEPLYDIAPAPCGDGIVDVQDLVLLSEYLFENVDDPTLIAHWALDEAEGDIAFDSAGYNDAFTFGAPLWQPSGGIVDGAIQLDGVDDCVIIGSVPNTTEGPFSVLAWVKGGAPGQVVLSQISGVNWLCTDPSEGNLMTELVGAEPLMSQTNITNSTWHKIGLVWDGSYRTLYVDDVAIAEDTQDSLEYSDGGLYLGCGKAREAGTYWSGLIDDIRIYNRVVVP